MTNDETVTKTDDLEGQPITVEDGQPESSPDQDANLAQKASVQKRINELTAKRYEEQRRADGLEAKVRELEAAQNAKLKPATAAPPTEPKLPDDPYDSEAMAQYHRQVVEHSARVAQETAQKALEDSKQAGIQEKQKAEQQQQIATYASNAVRDGVDLDKLRAAEKILISEGLSPELGRYIMSDQNGGKIAVYLHDNPMVRQELLGMDPVAAGIKIATEIKPQVLSTTPKVTGAPEPIRDIQGGGAEVKDEFERKYPDTVFI